MCGLLTPCLLPAPLSFPGHPSNSFLRREDAAHTRVSAFGTALPHHTISLKLHRPKKSPKVGGICPLQWMGKGFPGGTAGKDPACQCRRHKRYKFQPCVGKLPWRRAWQPTPVFLPGESHGQKSLAGYSAWGHKESDTTEATEYILSST